MEIEWDLVHGISIPDARKDKMAEEAIRLMETLESRCATSKIPWIFADGLNNISHISAENTMIVIVNDPKHFILYDCKVRARAKVKKVPNP